MTETLWTCIARCPICNRELNRAEHVPESKKSRVMISAPIVALCPIREHNTLSDLNLKVELQWIQEPRDEEAERA